MRGGAPTEP